MQVKQEDREAVSQWLADECGTPILREEIASLHEAFAAHRIAAEQRGYDRAIAEVVALVKRYEANPLKPATGWTEEQAEWFDIGCADTAAAIRSAIEAGEHLTAE